jgi:hypothetical protein
MEDDDNKIMTQPEKIEYILGGACDYFGINRSDLWEENGHSRRNELWGKKRYIIPLLLDYTNTSIRETGRLLGYKGGYRAIKYHYDTMKEELSGELYGSQKTKMIYTELLSYLKLNSYETTKTSNEAKKG